MELCGHVLHLRLAALVQQEVGLAARLTLLLPVGNISQLQNYTKLTKAKDLTFVILYISF